MFVGCLLLALQPSLAQNAGRKPSGSSPEATRTMMVEKAHVLEARGRPDLAIQLWQQILLSDPNNTESLEGLARDLKLAGSEKAIEALDRLRKAHPNDPNIAKIQAMASTRAENAQLRQAGDLAREGRVEDAMRLYKQLYGDRPPDGDIALAYYQALYGTAHGKEEAIAGMRGAAGRNPGDPRFAVELGTMLTYEPKTRAEGIRILREYPRDLNAQTALRRALVWDSANPASATELRDYLKEHPQDTELARRLKENEAKLAQMNSGIARTTAERAAFAALNAKRLDEAEKRFAAILDEEPNNGRAAAGMGFLRMQQNNFGEAINYLDKAEENGFKDRTVVDALSASHFWLVMGQASRALEQNQYEEASAKYREALSMRASSPEALNGLAGLMVRQQQYSGAVLIYDQLTKVQPDSTDGWRGLFLAYARDNQNEKALAVEERMPARVQAALTGDAEYLHTLANLYQAENRGADAQRVLEQALALPFPDNGASLKTDTKLEYAGILTAAKRYDQAAALYAQLLSDDPGNLSAWMGMVSVRHEMGQDEQAIAEIKKMPPATYEAALGDPGFLTMLGAIYQQANQYEVAQGLLERAAKIEIAAGGQPGVALELQLAGMYLLRNDTAHAYAIYQQVVASNPERAAAWKGLIAALQATNRNSEAMQQIAAIPAPVRKELDGDNEFVQTEASLYAAAGDLRHAIEFMSRVQAHYARLHTPPPAAIEIQNAWLLFNAGNDRLLYPQLMRLGSRTDLTTEQREMVQNIWANWSVRRAGAAMDNGNVQRAVDILDAASQAFPDNLTVRKAVAGGYVQVGRAKESLALYKTVPMQDATAGDFEGAIGAALAANAKSQAELWLRQALERFPRDPAILSLAARYEQARGDNHRAADYYRASLAAMPTASPQEKLAHVLVYPEQDTKAHRAVTAADLERLLNPDNEPFPKTTKVPALPAYGPDPYNRSVNGSAPVVVTPNPQPAQQAPTQQKRDQTPQPQPPTVYPPSGNQGQPPSAPVYVPQSWTWGRTRIASQPLRRAQGATPDPERNPRLGRLDDGRPRLMAATLQINPKDRFRMRGGFGSFRTASFAPRAVSAKRAAPGALMAVTAEAPRPQQGNAGQAQPSANAPRTQSSDAWKGLILSLVAGNRNAEAFEQLASIPPGVRAQLEADVEFVQAEADLYVSVGDIAHAAEILDRVEDLCLRRHAAVPAALEVQHAFLLDNLADDHALRPLLQRLDARADLTGSQRRQVEGLWAHSAARQAGPQVHTDFKATPSTVSSAQSPYAGRMKLPPSEETVDSTEPVSGSAAGQTSHLPPARPASSASGATPTPGLRITAQPMGPVAAQAQALFADQTDGQLTQGSAAVIHNLPNSPVGPQPSPHAAPAGTGQYNVAQYTPSAQEAATGAYSAPKQQQVQPTPPIQTTPPAAKPHAARSTAKKKPATTAAAKASQPGTPTLSQALAAESAQQPQAPQLAQVPAETPAPPPAPTTDTGLTDEELQQRNLPPLRGPWVRIQRQANPVSPRDEAEMQLRSIEAGYSPWMGGADVLNYRSGSLGYDHLAALEAPFEVSMPLGYNTRLTIAAKPVFLDSGQADGSSVITVQESTTAGSALVTIPQPIGTLTSTATTPPAQQNAVGIGGEVQLAFPHLALAGGYTPAGFLVATFTGRAMWKPGNGPFAINFSRDPVKDTQLSYSGLRDPSGNTLGSLGQIWGGIVANQGQVQFSRGDAESGFYVGVGGQYLTGYQVETNARIDGSGGAYWRLKTMPEYGTVSIGANFFGMHYTHNEDAFTHGMGGYFSPQSYFLANVPFTWIGHYGIHWHYDVLGSLGVQAFQEDLTPLWPLAVDKALETAMNNAMLPAKTSVGPNYDLRSHVAYQIGPHWFAGGFMSANNSRNYSAVSAGFSIHYLFRAQPSTATGPTGIFPTDGLRPFTVP